MTISLQITNCLPAGFEIFNEIMQMFIEPSRFLAYMDVLCKRSQLDS